MTSPTQAAIARQQEARPSLTTVVQRMVPEIQRAVPKHLDGDRIARIALTLLRKDAQRTDNGPRLADCTAESFAGSLLTSAALGLEPGLNGEAYLVPYKTECTFIAGYQGLVKLFYQHPLAQYITAETVHDADHFDYAKGLDPYLTHKPAKGDRGPVVYYYAAARLTTGAKDFVVLTPDEVKALRQGKVGPSGKIADPMRWMERKTAVRQLVKMMPKSPTLTHALEADEQGGHELHRQLVAENAPAMISAPPAKRVRPAKARPQHLPQPPAEPEPPAQDETLPVEDPPDGWDEPVPPGVGEPIQREGDQ
jgi:recombination protein RecT